MNDSAQLRSGKGSRDENFPVASWLIKRRHRPVILAFYEFVRVADDIADHPTLGAEEKLARLDRLEASLLVNGGEEPEGVALRAMLRQHGLPVRHAQDLLNAFRQDVTKLPVRSAEKYSVVCANLVSSLLVKERKRILGRLRPGGFLVLAGILETEFSEVQSGYETAGWRLVAGRTEREWRSGVFVERQSVERAGA